MQEHDVQLVCVFVLRLVGDVLLCTAFLSYCGPFNQDFRLMLNKNWMKELKNRKIPFTINLNLIDMLVDQTTVCWTIFGCVVESENIVYGSRL